MIEDFVKEVADSAMRSVATVTASAGLGDSVQRLTGPLHRLVVERLAARLAAGAEAEIFEREWVAFLGPDKSAAPDSRTQVLQVLKKMAEANKADLPARPDPMATLCEAISDAGAYGPSIDSIANQTVQSILKRIKGGRKGGFHDCRGLRYAVKDQAVSLFLEMENPDIDRLDLFMRVSVSKWVERVMLGDIL